MCLLYFHRKTAYSKYQIAMAYTPIIFTSSASPMTPTSPISPVIEKRACGTSQMSSINQENQM